MARLRDVMEQRKQMILIFIHQYRDKHKGVSPTEREIAAGIGYGKKSYGSVNSLVGELIKEGWLERATTIRGSRGLIPTRPKNDAYYPIKRSDLIDITRKMQALASGQL